MRDSSCPALIGRQRRGMRLNARQGIELYQPQLSSIHWVASISNQDNIEQGDVQLDPAGGFTFRFQIPEHCDLGACQFSLEAHPP